MWAEDKGHHVLPLPLGSLRPLGLLGHGWVTREGAPALGSAKSLLHKLGGSSQCHVTLNNHIIQVTSEMDPLP